MKAADFVTTYLTFMLSFLGMTDLSVFRIEGTMVPGVQDTAVQKGIDSIVID